MTETLSGAALDEALAGLAGWAHVPEARAIERTFRFSGFGAAFGFMAQVALLAEKAGHHPDWSNSYNRVTISLSTHDKGGITEKDIALARAIDAVAG